VSNSTRGVTEETKILHIITRSDWGGAPRVVKLLATGTEATTAMACGTGGKLITELRVEGIPVFEQPSLQSTPDPVADTRAFAGLYRLLRRESFDLIHCHSTKAGLLGRLAAKLAGIPTVFTVHGWGFYNTDYGRAAPAIAYGERALARITDTIVCVAENDLIEGEKRGITNHTRSTVVHNGIPPISVPADRRTLYEETDIEPGTIVIGAIARLAPQKNPLAILRAGNALRKRGHNVAVVVIGDGPLAEECERYVDEHDINAHLLGFHERALELLVDFDVFLMPSRFEGFPLTVLECLHACVPVVAYDVGGIAEAIRDGETGFVVTPGDEETFVDRLERLVTNPERREEMSARAETVAQTHYTAERMVADYERVYANMLDNK
jgi:glycosyltransferase involved in cell wall biosynthesis